ncbi:2-oxo-4-hydroxy-4-carboxy-5-ureidoimidazoline decarboxylase [Pollutimonas harenae]|uniref:2-oxo-4-hydroxy-4-carboxy-5-ureidoimidazoline decarboxylase n=1 Tax=Pollutimonas harenae TaxID=657015 RepID=A0A853H1V3_9BURK|nr:2-oxo-4-hydroxy-4-carboxy-5-ureidoimidazoline decarboxylase [Pollutimonas harenae]NYT84553.1 2-oxo-4-hydroxy-4-carboxy-5-ureidoimidazoline decarboxylase [Pollutimonas harenae]TEA73054.1 2-oxo-4-hydroxy-4-carboxy-5-ureidoimidazoline decarboxylase [Pollutimonas harenae]
MTTTQAPFPTPAELSVMPCQAFTEALEGIFEHSAWVTQRAWHARPFDSVQALHKALLDAVSQADPADQLALIRAHPELAGKEAAQGTLTQASTQEQQGAGLDQCSADELARLRRLNAAYRERFGFPFIIAVKGLSRHQIMDAIDTRLLNSRDIELSTCLQEIGKIARFRLDARYS